MLKKIILSLTLCALTFLGSAHATLISGGLNVDNGFIAYLSTDDNSAGTQISSGFDWPATIGFSGVSLSSGQDYYLHVYGYDVGGIAGFLGEFDLTGLDHTFSNGGTNLVTNTTDWLVSTSGWGSYTSPTDLGLNGAGPWGFRPGVDASASWIWSSDPHNDNGAYFTTMISAVSVPEPTSILLLMVGLFGLMTMQKKSQSVLQRAAYNA